MAMGLRFSRRVRLAKGVSLNVSKRGVGLSVGVRGFRVGVGPRGPYVSVGIPGTGLYAVGSLKKGSRPKAHRAPRTEKVNFPVSDGFLSGGPLATRLGARAFALPAWTPGLAQATRSPEETGGSPEGFWHPRLSPEVLAALREGLRPPFWVRLRPWLVGLAVTFALFGHRLFAFALALGLLYEWPYRRRGTAAGARLRRRLRRALDRREWDAVRALAAPGDDNAPPWSGPWRDDAWTLAFRAAAADAFGETKAAVALYRRYLARFPDDPAARFRLGLLDMALRSRSSVAVGSPAATGTQEGGLPVDERRDEPSGPEALGAVVRAFVAAGRSVPPTALTALAAAHLTEGHADAALVLLAQVKVPRRQADAWIRSVRLLRAKAHLLLGREAAARRELALLAALGEGGGSTEALLAYVRKKDPAVLWCGIIDVE
ncbi:MAG: TPR domain protein, putative component of TonB system [Hydrogenibacillus schlegelii]|uniref:TPR domain protein, putative component of TonB system n=2 Tax=Hydrogenibacillus schlegelii TaxID=1484 RepID=A0A2T5G9D5_HYDSH|nr:MAG: TPR domain protein, putative component of TonB system [Hydrogenibacillus schlegelii]